MQSKELSIYRISILLIFLASMVVSLSFLDPINWPKQILLSVAAGYLVVQSLFISTVKKDNLQRRILVLLCFFMLCYFIPALVSKVDLSRFLWGTFGRNNGFVTNISLLLICTSSFFFARNLNSVVEILRIGAIMTFISGIYGYIQFWNLDFVNWSKQNEVFSFYGNSNFASAAFAVGAICSLLLCLHSITKKRTLEAWLSGINFVFLTCITYFTNSIQGILGITIAIVLVFIMGTFSVSRRFGWILITLAVPFAILILLGFYGQGPLGKSIYQYTLSLRFEYWMAGLRMGFDHLLFGVGYENYGDYFQRYRSDRVAEMTGVSLTTNNAHNPFIQIFSTLGLVGAIPIATLFVLSSISSIKQFLEKNRVNSKSFENKYAAILFLTAWSMAFFSIDNISIAILNWFLMGFVLGSGKRNVENQNELNWKSKSTNVQRKTRLKGWSDYRRGISILVTFSLFVISWASSIPNRSLAMIFANNQIDDANPNWLNNRQNQLLKVVENPMTRETEFKWAAEGFYNLGLEDATIKTLILGLRKFPNDMNLLDNLAFVYERKSDYESAVKIRKMQLDLEKRNWRIYYFLAMNLQRSGKVDEALLYLSQIRDLKKFMTQDEISQFTEIEKNFGK